MANCPNPACQMEFTPSPDHTFCDGCGRPLAQPRAPERASRNVAMGTEAPLVAAAPADSGGNKVYGFGDNSNTAARDVIINPGQDKFCRIGGEKISGNRYFECPGPSCNRSPLCDQHFDEGRRLCVICLEKGSITCAVCAERVPQSETFTCVRCRRIVGQDHLDPAKNWCTECVDQWAGIVQAIERDEVGISGGGMVVTRQDVELKNRVLRDKEGKPVATIKENTWYAKPKQWYRVRPNLLRRERQAMHRFYPDMKIGTSIETDLTWEGPVTTWSGNAYEILVRYPHRFPHAPPRAYVVSPKIPESRHIYQDGHLCLFHKDDQTWQPETTAATVMTWVSLWLHCYEVWQETGTWPRREHDDFVITTDY